MLGFEGFSFDWLGVLVFFFLFLFTYLVLSCFTKPIFIAV